MSAPLLLQYVTDIRIPVIIRIPRCWWLAQYRCITIGDTAYNLCVGIVRCFLVLIMRDKTWCQNLELVNHGRRFLALFSSILIPRQLEMIHSFYGKMLKYRFATKTVSSFIDSKLRKECYNGKMLMQNNVQMMTEVQSWPYSFPASEDFQKSDQRGNVSGRLLVFDRLVFRMHLCFLLVNEHCFPGNHLLVL